MKKTKKLIGLLLAFVMLFSITGTMTITAQAANGIESKVSSIKSKYPSNSYFSKNGKKCSHAQSDKCNNCTLSNINSSAYKACGNGATCWAFANYAFYTIFATAPSNSANTSNTVAASKLNSTAKYGDYVVCYNSSGKIVHYLIYLGANGSNSFYRYESNYQTPNKVAYKRSTKVTAYSKYKIIHAYNYDLVKNNSVAAITNKNVSSITNTTATVKFVTAHKSGTKVTNAGIQIKKAGASSWAKTYKESVASKYQSLNPLTTTYVIGNGKEVNYTLSKGTQYTYRAYVIINGKTYYGSEKSFTTTGSASTVTTEKSTTATTTKSTVKPSVTVNSVSNLGTNSAQVNFTANNPDKVTIKTVGVQVRKKGTSSWTTKSEAMNSSYVNSASTKMWWTVGSGKELNMSLSAGTTYEYRAYVVYNGTNYYSSTASFTTKSLPSVTVNSVSSLTRSSVQVNFTANNPSKLTIKTIGVQVRKKGASSWTTKSEAMNSSYVNSASTKMWWTVGSGKELNMSLSAGTTYEYRAYVVYNGANYYSATKTFTTKS